MMRLLIPLFSPATGTWGGLTRVIAIAEAAQKRGHTIAFCASGYLEKDLRTRGYQVYSTPRTTMFGLPVPISQMVEQRSQNASLPVKPGRSIGNWWFVLALSGLHRGSYLRELARAEMRAIQNFRPDAIFTDGDPGAFLLAATTGLPIATAYMGVQSHGVGSLPWQMVRGGMNSVLRQYGKPPRNPDDLYFGSSVLKIIPSIPELDGSDPNRADFCFVGHLLGDIQANSNDFRPELGKRYVFVYVGTGAVPLSALRTVLPQLFPADGPLTCLVGVQNLAQVERVGGVEFRPYVPAEAVLHCADWTICHAGQNTMIQSLRQGVPLILFPGPIFERRFNAQQVQSAGAGVMGELNEFTPEWLRAALARQADCAVHAQTLGEQIRQRGGAPTAVEAIERHVQAGVKHG